jgi:hypothetical protein
VLGDGDAHAGEELVVEVPDVGGAKLVAREEERVLQRQVRVQPRLAQPRVPVHFCSLGRRFLAGGVVVGRSGGARAKLSVVLACDLLCALCSEKGGRCHVIDRG